MAEEMLSQKRPVTEMEEESSSQADEADVVDDMLNLLEMHFPKDRAAQATFLTNMARMVKSSIRRQKKPKISEQ